MPVLPLDRCAKQHKQALRCLEGGIHCALLCLGCAPRWVAPHARKSTHCGPRLQPILTCSAMGPDAAMHRMHGSTTSQYKCWGRVHQPPACRSLGAEPMITLPFAPMRCVCITRHACDHQQRAACAIHTEACLTKNAGR